MMASAPMPSAVPDDGSGDGSVATSLAGRTALVTGGCSGIGLATAELLSAAGARVTVGDVQDARGGDLVRRAGGAIAYVHCDVTDEAQIAAAIAHAADAAGGLDILINNAGAPGVAGPIDTIAASDWDATFGLLVRSVFLGMKHAAPRMVRRGGAIVNLSSVAATHAGFGPIAYSAAKAAVRQMTKVAAAELSPRNIRVNAVSPGVIATGIFGTAAGMARAGADAAAIAIESASTAWQPLPRPARARDVAQTCLFLASDAAAFITGTDIVVDGGLTVGPPHAWDPTIRSPVRAWFAQRASVT